MPHGRRIISSSGLTPHLAAVSCHLSICMPSPIWADLNLLSKEAVLEYLYISINSEFCSSSAMAAFAFCYFSLSADVILDSTIAGSTSATKPPTKAPSGAPSLAAASECNTQGTLTPHCLMYL